MGSLHYLDPEGELLCNMWRSDSGLPCPLRACRMPTITVAQQSFSHMFEATAGFILQLSEENVDYFGQGRARFGRRA